MEVDSGLFEIAMVEVGFSPSNTFGDPEFCRQNASARREQDVQPGDFSRISKPPRALSPTSSKPCQAWPES